MKILIHNMKMDDQNRNEVIKSLESRLLLIEEALADSYNLEPDENDELLREEYL